MSLLQLLRGSIIFLLFSGMALAQQQPPPPADMRALASGMIAIENQTSALHAVIELYIQRRTQEEKALADYWAAYVAGLK